MTPYYRQFIKDAEDMLPSECLRHARVAIDNHCRCLDCFCCACAHVVSVREVRGLFWVRGRRGTWSEANLPTGGRYYGKA
jgi:hypothetical protein